MPILENNVLWIREARLSFPQVLQPKPSAPGAEAKYSAAFLLTEQSPEWAELHQMIAKLCAEKWGDKAQQVMNVCHNDRDLRCYGWGSEGVNKQTGEIYEGYNEPGAVFIKASSRHMPKLYGPDAQELPPTSNANEMFVGGNYVAGVISLWAQDNQHGRAIRANLDGVQYLREGEHFGSEGPDVGGIFQPAPGAPAPTAPAPGVPVAPGAPQPAPVAPAPAKNMDFL